MPIIPAGAKTTDLAPTVNGARKSGFLGRLADAGRYVIAGVLPDTWMSPNQPIAPQAQEAKGRLLDFPVGYNLLYAPRGEERTSFATLRALADNCDLVRMAVETRKDQMASMKWAIGHVDPDKDTDGNPDAKDVVALLRKPDGVHGWQTWLRMALEEVMVPDALAVYPRTLGSGQVARFELMDGTTLKVLSDADGRVPEPPSPAYQQRLKGMPAVDYASNEILYMPRNPRVHKFYGFSPVEQIMLTVNIALRRAALQLQFFTEGNIPAAFATVPKEWTPQQIKDFQKYWDSVIEGRQAFKRKVRFAPGDMKVTQTQEAPLKDEFDEWLARLVCYAFSLPPTAFVKQMNRATAEAQQEAALKEGLMPLMVWVKEVMDDLIGRWLGRPDLEFRWVEEEDLGPATQATILTTYQKTGVYSVNDIRRKLGEDPVADKAADAYMIITATGATPLERSLEPPQPPPMMGPDGKPIAPKPGEEPKPDEPKPDEPKPGEPAEKVEHDHLHKADTSPLTPPMRKIKDAFAVAFGEVRDAAVKAVAKVHKAAGADGADGNYSRDAEELAAWEGFVDKLDLSGLSLAWDDYTDTLVAVSAGGARFEVARIVAEDPSVEAAARGAGFDLLDHQDPNAIAWANQHAAEMLSSDGAGGELAEATRNMIRQALTQALDAHQTDAQIAQSLGDAYAFSEDRADLIARTEVRNALGNGAFEGAKTVGMQAKRWLKSNDEGICPLCEANAAQQWIEIGKAFISGAKAPLQHPNCRCDAAYRRQPVED